MSFSSDCKEELCRVRCDKSCCRLAELSALYMTLGALSLLGRGQLCVQFTVESPAIARRVFVLLQKEAQIASQLHYVTHARFGGHRKCVLTVGPHHAPALLLRLGMMEPAPESAPSEGGGDTREPEPSDRRPPACDERDCDCEPPPRPSAAEADASTATRAAGEDDAGTRHGAPARRGPNVPPPTVLRMNAI